MLDRAPTRPRLFVLSTVAIACCSGSPARSQDAVFEVTDRVPAARFLAAEQMRGADWQIATDATNDGFVNTYTITSRFGTWTARGTMMAAVRIREVQALAELERVSKSSVFVDAVKRSAVGQIETVAAFATQPVETVKGIPGGVKRWLQKTSYQVSEVTHDVKTKAKDAGDEKATTGDSGGPSTEEKAKQLAQREALDYLKISGAERRWYAELGVDPYTDNQALRKTIHSYARIEGLTSFGMKFVGLPAIPGVGAIRKTMDLVWNTDPWELRRRNRKILVAAGVAEDRARAFEDNPAFSLTMQTSLVDSFEALAGVTSRELLLARALDVESRADAQMLVQATALLLRFHAEHRPLAAILDGTRLPVARAGDDALIATAPADAFFWTAEMAEAATSFAGAYAAEPASGRQLWLAGEASPRFKAEASRLGWEVRDDWQLPAATGAAAPAGGR